MATFTDDEKEKIRSVLGFSTFYIKSDTRLETAITQLEATAQSAVTIVKANLVKIIDLDDKLDMVALASLSKKADETETNGLIATALLQKRGRAYIREIVIKLDFTGVFYDYYSGAQLNADVLTRHTSDRRGN